MQSLLKHGELFKIKINLSKQISNHSLKITMAVTLCKKPNADEADDYI